MFYDTFRYMILPVRSYLLEVFLPIMHLREISAFSILSWTKFKRGAASVRAHSLG